MVRLSEAGVRGGGNPSVTCTTCIDSFINSLPTLASGTWLTWGSWFPIQGVTSRYEVDPEDSTSTLGDADVG